MQPKRTLSDALQVAELTPDARAFLKVGGATSAEPPALSPPGGGTSAANAGPTWGTVAPTPAGPAPVTPDAALVSATVSMTFRLPASLAAALLRSSVERRLQNAERTCALFGADFQNL